MRALVLREQSYPKNNYVPKICSRYRLWTHLGTFKNICSPRYKGGKICCFYVAGNEGENLIFCGSVVNKLDPCGDFEFV